MIYGFNHHNNFDFNKLRSILLAVVLIILGTIAFYIAKDNYLTYAPLIEIKLHFLGIVGVWITKIFFGFMLLMIYGILVITLCIRIMQFISNIFF